MSSKPNLKWRPATKDDIGRLARFGAGPFDYGLLVSVEFGSRYRLFECQYGNGEIVLFYDCEVQYDANEEPL